MRIPVVRSGDPTTTGGVVIAVEAAIQDKGKKVALDGEHATCGNCKGSWPMYGTGERMRNRGKPVVLQGDRVLCPCGKNFVMAGADAGCFVYREVEAERPETASSVPAHAHSSGYDELFALMDDAQRPLANVRYRIIVDGKIIAGITDAQGKTERVSTQSASSLQLQIAI